MGRRIGIPFHLMLAPLTIIFFLQPVWDVQNREQLLSNLTCKETSRVRIKEGELLVKFKTGTSDEAMQELHGKIGSEVVREFHSTKVQHIRLKTGLRVEETVRHYQADPNVEYAELVGIVTIQK